MSRNATFDALLEAAHFTFRNCLFEDDYRWSNKGDCVRGSRFELVEMDHGYTEQEARDEVERRFPGARMANAFEMVYYAAKYWNGTDWVIAFGSTFDYRRDYRASPCLYDCFGLRGLGLEWTPYGVWSPLRKVLCVCD